MLIFLDFDGVLRRKQAPLYRLEPELVARFEEALRALPTARVVITSSWREAFSLSEMRAHFSPDAARRVIGVTPVSQGHDGFYRHREVLAYLRGHGGAGQPWVALDDDPEQFAVEAPGAMDRLASGLPVAEPPEPVAVSSTASEQPLLRTGTCGPGTPTRPFPA